MLIKLLQNYGFSKNDARVYLETLKFSESTASTIARRIGENRITVYSILKSLTLRGISKETIKNGKKYYSMITPQNLVEIYETKTKKLKDSIPDFLKNIYSNLDKPNIKFYEGLINIKKIYNDILNSKGEILQIACNKINNKEIYNYLNKEYQQKRIKLKKETRLIYHENFSPFLSKNIHIKNMYTYRKILAIKYPIIKSMNSIILYGKNKTALLKTTKNYISCIIIEDTGFFGLISGLFETIRGAFHKNIKTI